MRLKKNIVNIILTCVVIGLAIAPIAISKIQEQNLLRKLYVSKFDSKELKDISSIPVEDKLKLMYDYSKKDKNVVYIEKQSENSLSVDDISSILKSEFEKMQVLGILPNIKWDNPIKVNEYSVMKYMDVNDPQNDVTIWEGMLTTSKYDFYLWMDMETNKIYQFSLFIYDETNSITSYNSLPVDEFSEYLGVTWDNSENNKKNFNYYGREICTLKNGEVKYSFYADNNTISFSFFMKSMK